jgi:hypothetical protein
MVTIAIFFQDFFGIFNFGHFFLSIFENPKYFWEKKDKKLIILILLQLNNFFVLKVIIETISSK